MGEAEELDKVARDWICADAVERIVAGADGSGVDGKTAVQAAVATWRQLKAVRPKTNLDDAVREENYQIQKEQSVWDTKANLSVVVGGVLAFDPTSLHSTPLPPKLHDGDDTNLDDIDDDDDDDDAVRRTPLPRKLHQALTELDKIVIHVLMCGAIRLICVKWLLMQPDNFKMPNRQELEALEKSGASPSPLLSPQEAAALVRRGDRSIGALTCCWLSPGDPDPALPSASPPSHDAPPPPSSAPAASLPPAPRIPPPP